MDDSFLLLEAKETRILARLAWNNWPDSDASRKIIAEHEAKDQFSANAWDRVVKAIADHIASRNVPVAQPDRAAVS